MDRGINTKDGGKHVVVIKEIGGMPHVVVRVVVGGMDPTILSDGKDEMEVEVFYVEGKEGPISTILEVILSPSM